MTLLIYEIDDDFDCGWLEKGAGQQSNWGNSPRKSAKEISTATLNLKITFPPIRSCLLSIVFISLHSKVTKQK